MSHPPVYLAQAHGKVLLFTLLISLSFPIGSALTAVLDPLVVTWVRYLLASLIFVGVLGCQGVSRCLPCGISGVIPSSRCQLFVTSLPCSWPCRRPAHSMPAPSTPRYR
ncbi:hypothetical protein ACTFBV_02615 [Aeromonas rivipollensis]